MSALPLKADMLIVGIDVCYAAADICCWQFNCPDKLQFDGSGDDTEDWLVVVEAVVVSRQYYVGRSMPRRAGRS
jgi:hypothetical protein